MTDEAQRGRLPPRVRLTIYGLCLVVCALSYLRLIPGPVGITSAAVVPLVWAVQAWRRQSRPAFLFAALVLFVALVPLLAYLR